MASCVQLKEEWNMRNLLPLLLLSLMAACLPGQELRVKWTQTSTGEQRRAHQLHDLGEVEPAIGPGFFGTVTFRDKAHTFAVTVPVRPPDWKMTESELRDYFEFQWPKGVTMDFIEFIGIRIKELYEQYEAKK